LEELEEVEGGAATGVIWGLFTESVAGEGGFWWRFF